MKEVLCIGGKHDGRRVEIEDDRGDFQLMDPFPVKITDDLGPITIGSFSVYIVEILYVKHKQFHFARPAESSNEETISLLFQNYRKPLL